MDPLSFAASLITVLSLVTASSKKIHDLRRKLQNAPKDVISLLEQVQTFESLLNELKTQLQDHRNNVTPQETLQQVWGSSLKQMQRDVQSLQDVLSKVETLVTKKSKCSKILLLARQMLSEKEVEQYRRKIDTHCGTLMNIQAMVCSRKLETVSQSISHLSNEDRAGLQTISSQISQAASQLDSETKAGFSTVSSQHALTESANQERHLTVLAHLDDHSKRDDLNSRNLDKVFQQQARSIDMNEAGFQAVHSSLVAASSSSSEDHKATQAMLIQCQGQLQQVIRNHVTFGTIENGLSLSTPRARNSNTIIKTTVFWKHLFYRMPIGSLEINLNESRHSNSSGRSTPQVCTEAAIAIQFVPPRWLSGVVINYSMKMSRNSNIDQWRWGASLNPLTVNYNPIFINAVEDLDVGGLRRSFAEGLAKPTDYILRWGSDLWPWYDCLGTGKLISDAFTRYGSMFSYMVANGLPGQEKVVHYLLMCRNGDASSNDIVRKHMHNYLKHGGRILGAKSEVFTELFMYGRGGGIEWIPDFYFNASEPWLVDDFSSLEICCIGILAQVDSVFCDRLKKELASYYSPLSLHRKRSADHLFETIFGPASIESRFRTLASHEPYQFLSLLCRTGSVAMIKPFLDLGVDIDGGAFYDNMLGNAAAVGNVDIVNMLLEAGANGSWAIHTFLHQSEHLPDTLFTSLLNLLVENARPTSFDPYDDPLLAVIRSSRALRCYPTAPNILLDRNVFSNKCFGGIDPKTHYSYSHMYQAISGGHSSVVDLLLRKGACADARISHLFDYNWEWSESCTWLTFAVMSGKASCADVLIRHGADVTALDGAGKSAIRLAIDLALGPHPRYFVFDCLEVITAEQDAETLVVVERAFNLKFQGTMSIEDFLTSSKEITSQRPLSREKSTPMLQRTLEKALGIFLTPSQTEDLLNYLEPLYRNTLEIWSLPFHEALLMRTMYVVSYAILFAYELYAFLRGRKRIPMPSRYLLSSLALLALAGIWGTSSQGGFGWGLFSDAAERE